MSLDINKLEKVVELAAGLKRAQCPACAETGQDKKGEHLRIYPDGKFGCCVFAGDREHRKRIFALAGIRERQEIRVKIAALKPAEPLQKALLGRLGRVFQSPTKIAAIPADEVGTLGTGGLTYRDLKNNFINHVYAKEYQPPVLNVPVQQVRLDFETPVPAVPTRMDKGFQGTPILAFGRLPFLTSGGTLVIPFDSPERYHWWKGGQSVTATMAEATAKVESFQ